LGGNVPRNQKTLMRLGVLSFLFAFTGLAHAQSTTQRTFGSIGGVPGAAPGQTSPAQAPSGVISGTVIDERGTPMTRVAVYALGRTVMPDGRISGVDRSVPTDENGRFRMDRLPAQSYVVAAAPMVFFKAPRPGVSASSVVDDQPFYAVTYFPGVIDRAQAQPIALAVAGEQTIFIEVQRVAPVHIRGTVSSPSGRSTSGVAVYLQRTIGSGSSSSQAAFVQDDGTFDITTTPGIYTVMANVSPGTAGNEFATANVRITADDVNGLALVLGAGGSVRGQIVFDSGAPGNAPLGAAIFLGPVPGSPLMMMRAPGSLPVADDWTFEAKGLYGTYQLSPPMILARQYRVSRVDFDGRDIGNNTVDIRDGEHQIVLHLSPR
jgi:hypothetical protein